MLELTGHVFNREEATRRCPGTPQRSTHILCTAHDHASRHRGSHVGGTCGRGSGRGWGSGSFTDEIPPARSVSRLILHREADRPVAPVTAPVANISHDTQPYILH